MLFKGARHWVLKTAHTHIYIAYIYICIFMYMSYILHIYISYIPYIYMYHIISYIYVSYNIIYICIIYIYVCIIYIYMYHIYIYVCDFSIRRSILFADFHNVEDTNVTQWEEPPSFTPAPPWKQSVSQLVGSGTVWPTAFIQLLSPSIIQQIAAYEFLHKFVHIGDIGILWYCCRVG